MKYLLAFSLLSLLGFSACNDREQKLRKRELELVEKEQKLLLKEKELALKEQNILTRERLLDTSKINLVDSAAYSPLIIGSWTVTMRCTETDCAGSAIGDVKNETWNITYQNGSFLSKVIVNDKLVRIYSGKYNGKTLDLTAQQDETGMPPQAKMAVQLKLISKNRMEGQRIIQRQNCRILYELEMTK
ncbi:hypothetical protein [Desertivirga xinjiangensis]|uniref:hypothetical protein n=1 Tax=Desertivirga xinjiangensis TaxID=539206 RepID=UPI00210AAF71|nr:hypothetical protein [Pedobacter xinjiangensis]